MKHTLIFLFLKTNVNEFINNAPTMKIIVNNFSHTLFVHIMNFSLLLLAIKSSNHIDNS